MTIRETGKTRLEAVLAGRIPDVPPHFELEFQLAPEMFGLNPPLQGGKTFATEAARLDAMLHYHIEVENRLIDELGYASARFCYDVPVEKGITEVKKALGHKALIRSYDWNGVFWMPNGDGLMDFVVRLFEEPESLHKEAREKCDVAKMRLRAHADAGTDFFVLAYDFGFNNGPFISPAQFQEFIVPYLTEIVATAHDLGKKAILHSDGDLRLLLEMIHSTGIDGYQSVDPQGHMDIAEVRRQYPDWILMGNVACNLLQDVDEERIRQSVRYCLEHGGVGKRYIFSTSNCIFKGMPPESYRIMLDEYRRITRREA
jgi:uroporphyrinogen decarboxylase